MRTGTICVPPRWEELQPLAGVRGGDLRLDAGTGNEILVPGIKTAICS